MSGAIVAGDNKRELISIGSSEPVARSRKRGEFWHLPRSSYPAKTADQQQRAERQDVSRNHVLSHFLASDLGVESRSSSLDKTSLYTADVEQKTESSYGWQPA